MVDFESEDEKKQLGSFQTGWLRRKSCNDAVQRIAVIWNKNGKRGIITAGWFYMEITVKHLQFICKTRKEKDMKNVTSIQIDQL